MKPTLKEVEASEPLGAWSVALRFYGAKSCHLQSLLVTEQSSVLSPRNSVRLQRSFLCNSFTALRSLGKILREKNNPVPSPPHAVIVLPSDAETSSLLSLLSALNLAPQGPSPPNTSMHWSPPSLKPKPALAPPPSQSIAPFPFCRLSVGAVYTSLCQLHSPPSPGQLLPSTLH